MGGMRRARKGERGSTSTVRDPKVKIRREFTLSIGWWFKKKKEEQKVKSSLLYKP